MTCFPLWMNGAGEEFLTTTACDLAKMHAHFANSPELDAPFRVEHSYEFLAGVQVIFRSILTQKSGVNFAFSC